MALFTLTLQLLGLAHVVTSHGDHQSSLYNSHSVQTSTQNSRPHIMFIVSDDLGYNDVSFHGSSQIPTPNLDALAHGGVILGQYYVQPVCSPTRATFMTGRHVIHTGVYDPMNGGSGDLSLNFSLWSDGFQKAGYATHAIGKWHLGMSSWRFCPLERGFDSYYGYLGGGEDYWTHVDGGGVDLFDGKTAVTNSSCDDGNACSAEKFYSANLFTSRAIRVIEEVGATSKPMFMYLAYQSVHSPDEAPQHLIDGFNASIPNLHRRTFAGMVAALDLGVGAVVNSLKAEGLFDNTLLIFTTDNGGPADNFNSNMACNYPLRGMKRTLFQGGVRGVGLIHGVGITTPGKIADGYVHASDWFHTLLRVAIFGVSDNNVTNSSASIRTLFPSTEPPFQEGDGVDVWEYLSGAMESSPRVYVLHEAHADNSTDGNGNALTVGDLKIVIRSGSQWSTGSAIGSNDGWYGGPGSSDNQSGSYCVQDGDLPKLFVQCPPPPADIKKGFACENDKTTPCLFNITADPCEHVDISLSNPAALDMMKEKLAIYRATSVESTTAHPNPDGNNCPYITVVNNVRVWMPCLNNGSHPNPAPSPPPKPTPPPPKDAFSMVNSGLCLNAGTLHMGVCDTTSTVWYTGDDGNVTNAIKAEGQCLKILEAPPTMHEASVQDCQSWKMLHLGVCRQDQNSISFVNGVLSSNLCAHACVGLASDTHGVQLSSCANVNAQGWTEGHV
eukprot:m.89338 g.89338  ORF g.89338 m.89338 type:complete len:724 (-) comp26286_c1_seq1:235-2406(-)